MQYLIGEIIPLAVNGTPFVLATIVDREGSSPRGVGACMLVTADGKTRGTVGGGSVEYETTKHAATLFDTKGSETQKYLLHPNEAADLGMVCGGRVTILFQYIASSPEERALFSALAEARADGKRAYLARRIEDGCVTEMHALVEGDLPARAELTEDGLLVEPVGNAGRVYVFGGGHVSQKLVPLLGYLGYRVVVSEDRAEFADKLLFPAAEEVRLIDYEDLAGKFAVTDADYVIVMTRGHQGDYCILRQTLKTPARYIGCIGSRAKVKNTRERLLKDGFTEGDADRIHSPIGLPIGAETPEEIAVSIAAELILHNASRR